jgi:hypothetical protein
VTAGELLLARLAPVIARALAKAWIADDALLGDTASSLTEFFGRAGLGRFERRKAARELDAVGERVIQRLEAFLEVEQPGGLPDNEAQAAIMAAADVIDAGFTQPAIVLQANADALALERLVRAAQDDVLQQALLSPLARRVYDFIVSESCAYIVQMATELPAFVPQAVGELLARTAMLETMLEQALAALPQPDELRARDFETRYRRAVSTANDWMTLIGLRASRASRRYALSIAYIRLLAYFDDDVEMHEWEDLDDEDPERFEEDAPDGIDELIARRSRLLVSGIAGSGKTTILQWLAVRAATRTFTGPLSELNGSVPFIVRLRAFAEGELPTPSQMARTVSSAIADLVPPGWAEELFADARALVLVDGIDELPAERREDVRLWLADLCEQFPRARYIVTSRPEALDDWDLPAGFAAAELAPMSLTEVDDFIDHWHRAIAHVLPDGEEKAAVLTVGERLKSSLRQQTPVRRLATNPLMSAVICAINRDGNSVLPKSRLELYDIALEFLLDRRDQSRRVSSFRFSLTRDQRRLLLDNLAWWMMSNGHSEAPVTDVLEHIGESLRRIEGDFEPRELLRYLLERTGLLRQPTTDSIDFVHRTFLEYLAATYAAAHNNLGLLLNRAHDAGFSEVVVLAAGLTTPERRDRFVTKLLHRATSEDEHKYRLILLAAQCEDVAPDLDPKVRDAIRSQLREFLPPRTSRDAQHLAAAGEMAVPMLPFGADLSTEEARASIRALALIGTPAAMEQLAGYGAARRISLVRELVRAWEAFDRDVYAQEVMSDSPLQNGALSIVGADALGFLASLKRLRHLRVDAGRGEVDLLGLSRATQLETLELSAAGDLADLTPLAGMERLRVLTLRGLDELETLAGVESLQLRTLHLDRLPQLESLGSLSRAAPSLTTLSIRNVSVNDLDPLRSQSTLENVTLALPYIETLEPFEDLDALRQLRVTTRDGTLDLHWLTLCPRLRELELIGYEGDIQFAAFGGLGTLSISRCSGLVSFEDIGEIGVVGELSLSSLQLRSLRGMDETTSGLKQLSIAKSSVGSLTGVPASVRFLSLVDTQIVEPPAPDELAAVRGLELAGVPTDLSWLSAFPALESLRLGRLTAPTLRTDALRQLQRLCWLDPGPYRDEAAAAGLSGVIAPGPAPAAPKARPAPPTLTLTLR